MYEKETCQASFGFSVHIKEPKELESSHFHKFMKKYDKVYLNFTCPEICVYIYGMLNPVDKLTKWNKPIKLVQNYNVQQRILTK